MLRQFAGASLVFFGLLAAHQTWARSRPALGLVLAGVGLAVGTVGLLWPRAVRWLFVGWMALAFPIGWLISQITLVVLFYGLFTPVALFFRLRARDLLRRKAPSGQATFWVERGPSQDLHRYFRQY